MVKRRQQKMVNKEEWVPVINEAKVVRQLQKDATNHVRNAYSFDRKLLTVINTMISDGDGAPAVHHHLHQLCTITDYLVRQHKRYTVTIQTNFYIVQVLLLCCFGPFLGHDLPKYQDFERIIFMGDDVSLMPNQCISLAPCSKPVQHGGPIVGRPQPAQLLSSLPHAISLAWPNKPYYID
jgi:hypothetical protein